MKIDTLLLFGLLIVITGSLLVLSPAQRTSVTTTPDVNDRTVLPTAPRNKTPIVEVPDALPDSETQEVAPVSLLGWIPYWDQEAALSSFKRNAELFDYISLFWYYLDADGNIQTYSTIKEDRDIIAFAHERGVEVLAVVANLPDYTEGGDWDAERVNRVISSQEKREEHINQLLGLLERNDFDGINIDYEALERSQREDFSIFIAELGEALRKEEKLLGVAIHPKTSEFNPQESNGSQAQDWEALSPSVDHMYFMTYEEHYDKSSPGPIASVGWMEDVLHYAIDIGVPREKIFMGIPQYGYDWPVGRGSHGGKRAQGLTYEDVAELITVFEPAVQFDSEAQAPYFTYGKNGAEHVVWFENDESLRAKLLLQKKYRIPNIALWRLGSEDPLIWQVLKTEVEFQ